MKCSKFIAFKDLFYNILYLFSVCIVEDFFSSFLSECNCNILFHTMLAGVKKAGDTIKSIKVCNKAGLSDIEGKIFIDATGDADLCYFSGVKYEKGREGDNLSQPMTTNLKITNVDIEKIKRNIKSNPLNHSMKYSNDLESIPRLAANGFYKELAKAKQNKDITFERETVLFFETNNKGEVILNMTRVIGKDATDPFDLSEAEIEGRMQAKEAFKFLKKYIDGFENAVFISTGVQIGVRESRRVVGKYMLTSDDIINPVDFSDTIAKGSYPIDIHNPAGNNTNTIHLKQGQVYNIPYRCLIPDTINNLLVCGRCISATHEACAAIRVTPIAMALGQAAGTAASLCAAEGKYPENISIRKLQELLQINEVI